MNLTKVLSASLMITVASFAFAQSTSTGTSTQTSKPGHKMAKQLTLLEELKLTPDQLTKVKAALKAHQTSMKALKESEKSTPAPTDIKEKRKEINKTLTTSLRSILTPAQMIKFDELKREAKAKAKAEAEKSATSPAPKAP